MSEMHFDVVIVGAGLSGIGAAVHLQKLCPGKTYAILERRGAIGGTWDLFRYPGIRSDSDMHTLGYRFKPWTDAKAIADGPSIRRYVRETAEEYGIDQHIRYNHHVTSASWSSEDARWTLQTTQDGTLIEISCNFLHMCAGYYNYDAGYTPDFAGVETFEGEIVHPQKWTEDVAYKDKKVVIIGSGATAVTLLPELAKDATHATMLQRSPTYMVALPAADKIANTLRKILPDSWAYAISRWKNISLGRFFYNRTQTHPERAKKRLLERTRKALGPDYNIERDFTPSYNPWEQRLCVVPDGDLFESLKSGKASVKTAHIEKFVPSGIELTSGEILEADLVVTATGLDLQVFGGIELSLDGNAVNTHDLMMYKGLMFADVPNFVNTFGYTNASWTLKADLTSEYVCRLINYMDETETDYCVPQMTDETVTFDDMAPLSSGYFARAADRLPRQGSKAPWQQLHNYFEDMKLLRKAPLEDGALQFVQARQTLKTEPALAKATEEAA